MGTRRYFATVPDRHGVVWHRSSSREGVAFHFAAVIHFPATAMREPFSRVAFAETEALARRAFRASLVPGASIEVLAVHERDNSLPTVGGRVIPPAKLTD